jgi:8-oxo-dGTP diphosphatase
MTEYVAGFLFYRRTNVALVTKKRPDWQKGKMNGVGGHIDGLETPVDAMRREFKEETGAEIDNWKLFCTCNVGDKARVYFFKSFVDQYVQLKNMTDEIVDWYNVIRCLRGHTIKPILHNLKWLIPMALDTENPVSNVEVNIHTS